MRSTLSILNGPRIGLVVLLSCAASAAAADSPSIAAIRNRMGGASAAAGDVVDIFGSNLAHGAGDLQGWPLPLVVGPLKVSFGKFLAPVLSLAPDRLRVQLPWELAGLKSVPVQVTLNGVSSDVFSFNLSDYAPAVIGMEVAAITPMQPLTLRVVGLGPRNRNPITGYPPTADFPGALASRVFVLIGGIPAPVTSTRLAAGGDVQKDAGVGLVTVMVPANVPAGDSVAVQVRVAGTTSESFPATVRAFDGPRVSVSPTSADVPLNGSQKFQAEVQGSDDRAVSWSTEPGEYVLPNTYRSLGNIDRNGLFHANYIMPSPSWGILRVSHASGAFATALVRLVAIDKNEYRIVPDSPVIAAGESITLSLVDAGGTVREPDMWWISDGYGGVAQNTYTAPALPPSKVIACARTKDSRGYLFEAACTFIFIVPPRARVVRTVPKSGHAGERLTIQGDGVRAAKTYVWFTMSDGTRVRAEGRYSEDPAGTSVTVPHGAVSGPAVLEAAGADGSTFLSEPFEVSILPRLRLYPARPRVSSGETIPITAAAPNLPGNWQLTWRADVGSVDSKGQFTAPITQDSVYARIWACLEPDAECGTTVVRVVPFRLETEPFILDPGEKRTLHAWRGAGRIAVKWAALTANISVLQDGTVTAGSGPFDGGRAVVAADAGDRFQSFELLVRSPGVVAATAEYADWLEPPKNTPYEWLALGAFSGAAAARGDWIYSISGSLQSRYSGPWLTTWMDVYQLDSRRNPVWVDAVEAPYGGGTLRIEGDTLFATGREGEQGIRLRFDISGGKPVLMGRERFTGEARDPSQGVSLSFVSIGPGNPDTGNTIHVTDHSTGTTRKLNVPFKPLYDRFDATIVGTAEWAAVLFYYPFVASGNPQETVVFDITGESAEPIGFLATGSLGGSMRVLGDVLVVGNEVYQVRDRSVAFASQLESRHVVDADPVSKRLLMTPSFLFAGDGYRVVDLSDPFHPKVSAPAAHGRQWTWGALGPDYFVLGEGPQSLAVYPISWKPGVSTVDEFPASPYMTAPRIRDGYLYWTGAGIGWRGRTVTRDLFEVVDLSSKPFRVVATLDRPGDQVGWAVELNGTYAYVGTDTETIVYDIRIPGSPVENKVIPSPAISMALLGKFLYAGSNTGKNTTLLVYDVSDAANPRLVNSLSLPEFAYAVTAQPGWLAVAMGKSGLRIYSLANPSAPVMTYSMAGKYWGVAGAGNILYTAADSQGLLIFDITRLQSPGVLGQMLLSSGQTSLGGYTSNALAVSYDPRGIVWVCTDRDARVYGVDVREPREPRVIFEAPTAVGQTDALNTAVWNGLLVIAGNNLAFDTSVSQNVGLYYVPQSWPGLVLPSRSWGVSPLALQPLSVGPDKSPAPRDPLDRERLRRPVRPLP